MGAVEEYRARRDARLSEKRRVRIDEFRKRRSDRLTARGILPVEYRADDEEEKENDKNESASSGSGHGNTRLPFGLCKRFGIEIGEGWTPRDAWDALAGKGITADGAFERLKKGEDPGTPPEGGDTGAEIKVPEPPKDPVKKIHFKTGRGEADYESLTALKPSYVRRGEPPWRLYGDRVEGSYATPPGETPSYLWRVPPRRMSESFWTKADLLRFLKEQGVEEFKDPETGELINPKEMDLAEPKFVVGRTGYTAPSIGLRDGVYTVSAKDMDGKSRKLYESRSLASAQEWLKQSGVSEADTKLSPALKKREKERVNWLRSGHKEYIEKDGVKYGDLKIDGSGGYWEISGESEDGARARIGFGSRTEAMDFLKKQGVEKVKLEKDFVNPQDVEIPKTAAMIHGRAYQEVGLGLDTYGRLELYGIDLDGEKTRIAVKASSSSYDDFVKRLTSAYSIPETTLTIGDEAKAKIEEIKKEEERRARIKAEFEQKALSFGPYKYSEVELVKSPYGDDYVLKGYDEDGDKMSVSREGDLFSVAAFAEKHGYDLSQFIKDDSIRKEYEEHKKRLKEFEARAVDFAGDKYTDVAIEGHGRYYSLVGYDKRGRRKEFGTEHSYKALEDLLKHYGHSVKSFPMDDSAKKMSERAIKTREAIATGKYYDLGKRDEAFKDVRIEQAPDYPYEWVVKGTDIDGQEKIIDSIAAWDDAIDLMSTHGVKDYKIKDSSGAELRKPKWGMHKVMLMRKPGGGYLVYADSDRYGSHAIMYETPKEEEARKWLRDNGVPDSGIKTRGMNPNDDVPRTHTAKSLSKFDTHRIERAEKNPMISGMSDKSKQEVADMLTEMFDKGAFRLRAKDHFEQIFDEHFKNLLETGTSGGSTSEEGRRITGEKTFGHAYDIEPIDAEKYGYWGGDDDKEEVGSDVAHWYGGTLFKFKKDKIGDRVTYTMGDSLDAGRPIAGYAGKNPTIEGISALSRGNLREVMNEYKRYKNGEISFNDFRENVSGMCRDGYVECQYHGMLTLDDVESITFPERTHGSNWGIYETFKKMTPEKRKKVIASLKDRGITLRYYDRNNDLHDGYEYLEREFGGAA